MYLYLYLIHGGRGPIVGDLRSDSGAANVTDWIKCGFHSECGVVKKEVVFFLVFSVRTVLVGELILESDARLGK